MRGYYGDNHYGYGYGYRYGYSPYIGQQAGPSPRIASPRIVPYDWEGPSAPRPAVRKMSYKDAYWHLVECMKKLDAAAGEEIVTLMIWLGINEAAEGERWSRRKIEDTVAQTISMSAVRNQSR